MKQSEPSESLPLLLGSRLPRVDPRDVPLLSRQTKPQGLPQGAHLIHRRLNLLLLLPMPFRYTTFWAYQGLLDKFW